MDASIATWIQSNAECRASRPAILADGMKPLSHVALRDQVTALGRTLNASGLGRGDRVAIVLPPGPELAITFLGVACTATAAPLNPGYQRPEFEFYLRDLQVRAVVLRDGEPGPARDAARALGLPILELQAVPDGDIPCRLQSIRVGLPRPEAGSTAEDVALVLHTSGTTARPKRVPLTHRNLVTSARNIATTLGLTHDDRCLNVMPLFHIHGLVACVLAPLVSGGSTVCSRGFDATRFDSWIQQWSPTWYSAVPTLHQAILAIDRTVPTPGSLRFIRSSSAALPPSVMARLESVWGVPVIESYGMTEAAHQMASNPLPPRARKPGSVGLPAGPEIAILDSAGRSLPADTVGEVAIRGANVTPGYEDQPEANAVAFEGGWFRTGDQGFLDADGYLTLTGRLKELINRGGEKVAPREVDEALLAHPEVQQAVAFAVPHPSLGEDVAAAVVVRSGSVLTEAGLREFALERLPLFKAPSRIVFVDQIPKGATGKVQRIGLAARMEDALAVTYAAPATPLEQQVARIMQEVLGGGPLGRHHNFFAAGGDSLRAGRVLNQLRQDLDLDLPVGLIFRNPTPEQLGLELQRRLDARELDRLEAALQRLPAEEQARLLSTKVGP